MIHDEEDNIISTDMYVKQQNYGVRKLWNRLSEKK